MTIQARPTGVAVLPPVPVRGTIAEAWRLTRTYPRLVLLPMYVIQVPVAVVSAVINLVLYLTVFSDKGIESASALTAQGLDAVLFASLALAAFDLLFSQVARGATVVGVTAAVAGRPEPLTQLLDPAFTRMGGLLLLALVPIALLAGGLVTIVGTPIAVYAVLRMALATEAYMLEKGSPSRALRRSWNVLSGSMWRFLGALLLTFLMVLVPVLLIVSLPAITWGGRTNQLILLAILTVLQSALAAPFLAFLTAVTTVFYLRVKVRHDARTAARN